MSFSDLCLVLSSYQVNNGLDDLDFLDDVSAEEIHLDDNPIPELDCDDCPGKCSTISTKYCANKFKLIAFTVKDHTGKKISDWIITSAPIHFTFFEILFRLRYQCSPLLLLSRLSLIVPRMYQYFLFN